MNLIFIPYPPTYTTEFLTLATFDKSACRSILIPSFNLKFISYLRREAEYIHFHILLSWKFDWNFLISFAYLWVVQSVRNNKVNKYNLLIFFKLVPVMKWVMVPFFGFFFWSCQTSLQLGTHRNDLELYSEKKKRVDDARQTQFSN